MDLSGNDDETMSRNRSEYVNQLLEQNRQVWVASCFYPTVEYSNKTRAYQCKSVK